MIVKNIILDLGGVVINLDYHKTAQAFVDLGLKHFNELYSQKKQDHFFDDFEKGVLKEADFRKEIRSHLKQGVSDEEIDRAWNAMLLDVPEHRMHFLRSLKKHYRLFLLSNTNCIHETAFTEIVNKAHGEKAFETVFEKIYYSCRMNMRKPDKEIFEFVLSDNALKKEETVFIDDSPQHVEGATAAGIRSYLLDPGMTLEELIPLLTGSLAATAGEKQMPGKN